MATSNTPESPLNQADIDNEYLKITAGLQLHANRVNKRLAELGDTMRVLIVDLTIDEFEQHWEPVLSVRSGLEAKIKRMHLRVVPSDGGGQS